MSRFMERTRRGAAPAHLVSWEKVERRGGAPELAAMYDRLLSVIAARPRARVVPTHHGEVDRAYRDFLRCLLSGRR